MKRAHRKTHLLMWIVLTPLIVVTLFLAVLHRPAEPVNAALAAAIVEEAR
jgi:hypothetical protein